MELSQFRCAFNRRQFLALAGSSALATLWYAGEFERHNVEVVRRTIRLLKLPSALSGLRVVQISDIHFEEYTEPYFLRDVIRRVNALNPDVIALTGDYVSYAPLPKREDVRLGYRCAELLNSLTCQHKIAVLGNHDVLVGEAEVTDALRLHGITVLSNRSVPFERDGKRIWFAGVGDVSEHQADLDAALSITGLNGDESVILLAHEPDFADLAAHHRGIDLMLSGHTHGGQIRLPFLGPLVLPDLGKKYVEGLFPVGHMQLYVNRGIGTVSLPIRFRCRPEITLLTLEGPTDQTLSTIYQAPVSYQAASC